MESKDQDTQKAFESLKDPHTCDLNLDFLFAPTVYANFIRPYDHTDVLHSYLGVFTFPTSFSSYCIQLTSM